MKEGLDLEDLLWPSLPLPIKQLSEASKWWVNARPPQHLCVGLQASNCGLKKLSGYNPCLTLVLTRTLRKCSPKMSMDLMVMDVIVQVYHTNFNNLTCHSCSLLLFQAQVAQIHFYLEHLLGLPMSTVSL